MDTILQEIPNFICYIDGILVTGADDQTHLCNLAEVLQRWRAWSQAEQGQVQFLGVIKLMLKVFIQRKTK